MLAEPYIHSMISVCALNDFSRHLTLSNQLFVFIIETLSGVMTKLSCARTSSLAFILLNSSAKTEYDYIFAV